MDPDEMSYWNDQLLSHGATVVHRRREAIAELNERATDLHVRLSGGVERLQRDYQPTFPVQPDDTEEHVLGSYRSTLSQHRQREIERGATLIGPHRDEVRFVINDEVDLGRFGSRGQQRTAVVAVKLAEVAWMHHRTGEWPILLLDEVLAELDSQRRDFLLAQVNGVEQTLITTTDPAFFDETRLAEMTLYRVEAGRVVQESV
jgi:DNA replication and repair protein RecF